MVFSPLGPRLQLKWLPRSRRVACPLVCPRDPRQAAVAGSFFPYMINGGRD